MLPQERDLVQRLADQPFTLLGINSDKSRSALKKIIDEQKITWPQIFDGTRGPIARQWNVKSWPTIYVIDQQGVIRYRNVRGEALEKAVAALLGKGPRQSDSGAVERGSRAPLVPASECRAAAGILASARYRSRLGLPRVRESFLACRRGCEKPFLPPPRREPFPACRVGSSGQRNSGKGGGTKMIDQQPWGTVINLKGNRSWKPSGTQRHHAS